MVCPACKGIIRLDLDSRLKKENHSFTSQPIKKKLQGEALKKEVLRNLKKLFPMPHVMLKAREIIDDPNSSFKNISKVIQTDQALASRVLKVANSPYYGMQGKISTIHHAAFLLGIKLLAQIVTIISGSKMMGRQLRGYGYDSGTLWRHALAVAVGSKIIAARVKPGLEKDAFSAGLIHDAGKIILDPYILERKEIFNAFMKNNDGTFLRAEQEILGFDHSEIASELCKTWNIPEVQAIAVKYHHCPSCSQAYIRHVANIVAIKSGLGAGERVMDDTENGALEFLGLQEGDIDNLINEVLEDVETIEDDTL